MLLVYLKSNVGNDTVMSCKYIKLPLLLLHRMQVTRLLTEHLNCILVCDERRTMELSLYGQTKHKLIIIPSSPNGTYLTFEVHCNFLVIVYKSNARD